MTNADVLDRIVREVVEPNAVGVDRDGRFPRENLDALAHAGFLGLVSAREVGGGGGTLRDGAAVVRRLATTCGSTAMVVCMHYAATAVLEAHGPRAVREAVAAGRHLTTLAFSERGSRSQFWAPMGTATPAGGQVLLNAAKSWVTAAGEADSYIWSSRPVEADGASSLWLVPRASTGLKVDGAFDGLGLRGNDSCPVMATDAAVPRTAMLGADGGGFDVMIEVVLPWFTVMSAAMSVGTSEAAVTRACSHAASTRYEHLGQSLAETPTTRLHLARARVLVDQASALLEDTIATIESGRPDTMLRVLEVKAAAGDAALAATDLAMRVCGGAAFRREVGVERNFRDARAAAVMAPTSDALYDFIGRALCGLPVF